MSGASQDGTGRDGTGRGDGRREGMGRGEEGRRAGVRYSLFKENIWERRRLLPHAASRYASHVPQRHAPS